MAKPTPNQRSAVEVAKTCGTQALSRRISTVPLVAALSVASAGGSRRVADLLVGRLDPAENPLRPDRPLAAREHDIL